MSNKNQEAKELKELIKENPTIPSEIFDIEPSQELAEQYYNMFGY